MSAAVKEIEVNVVSFEGLFEGKKKVVIPEYQRPYEWGKTKTSELLADLKEYFLKEDKPLSPYYMGSVLFYYDNYSKCYEIIDGQQRITTLLILKNTLNRSLPDNQNINYDSHLSFNAIRETTTYAKSEEVLLKRLNEIDFLKQLEFTQVITYSQDDSFAFFDTQNNRGVSLGASDFLKAYHLREIPSQELQQVNAVRWESAALKWEDEDFLNFLFNKILFRAREWKSKNTPFETKQAILEVFQKKTIESSDPMTYPLFSNNQNRQATYRTYHIDGKFTTALNTDKRTTPALFPFNLRQPIYKGLNFFHFTEKYTAIHGWIFDQSATESDDLIELRKFYDEVYTKDMSIYLRHLFKLCVIMYYDVFEDKDILKFAYYLDYLVGSIRVGKSIVKKESAQKCLTEPHYNLLDIVAYAYEPAEVIQFINEIPKVDNIYKEIFKKENKLPDDGVQPRYRDRVLGYFEKPKRDFKNRKQWLNE
jgi:hypothetical protein